MADETADLRAELDRLKAENAQLKKELVDTRAQRAEYLNYLSEFLPPANLPTEEEMAEQMKHLVPADQVFRANSTRSARRTVGHDPRPRPAVRGRDER